jgi:hypothetical protein
MTELSDKEVEIVRRHRRVRQEMEVSSLEGVQWFPGYGSAMGHSAPEERPRFIAYAKKLIDQRVPQITAETVYDYWQDDRYTVYPFWHIQGVPSKKGKPIAERWMSARGCDWAGDTKSLRAEVERALIGAEKVPLFGLHIRLLIYVKDPR